VLTQTIPGPPPGAGDDFATVSALAVAPAAAGLGEPCGLNKSANVFFAGVAEALGAGDEVAGVVIAVFLRAPFDAGSVSGGFVAFEETVIVAEGEGVAAAFLRDFFAGEALASAAGDSLAAGDACFAAFFRDFLAGEAEASGEEACDALASGDGD